MADQDDKRFPIQRPHDWKSCPRSVPWAMMAPQEAQAFDNHDQSLTRLAERGGLDPTEALAVLEGRPWRNMTEQEAVSRLNELVASWGMSHGAAYRAGLAAALAELAEMKHQGGDAIRLLVIEAAIQRISMIAERDSG